MLVIWIIGNLVCGKIVLIESLPLDKTECGGGSPLLEEGLNTFISCFFFPYNWFWIIDFNSRENHSICKSSILSKMVWFKYNLLEPEYKQQIT